MYRRKMKLPAPHQMHPEMLPFYVPGLTLAIEVFQGAVDQMKEMLGQTGATPPQKRPYNRTAAPAPTEEKPGRQRRRMSAAARKRIGAAQKKRWREHHERQEARQEAAGVGKPKGKAKGAAAGATEYPDVQERRDALVKFASKHDGKIDVPSFREHSNGKYPEQYFTGTVVYADLKHLMNTGVLKKVSPGHYELK